MRFFTDAERAEFESPAASRKEVIRTKTKLLFSELIVNKMVGAIHESPLQHTYSVSSKQ